MKKNKIITYLILIVLLLGCSLSIYIQYPTIYKQAYSNEEQKEIQSNFINLTNQYHYILSQKLIPNNEPYSQFIQSDVDKNSNEYKEYYQTYINDMKDFENIFNKDKDIDYYAIDLQTNKTISNTSHNLTQLKNDTHLQSQYQYYYQITYNELGQLSIDTYSNNFYNSLYHGLDYGDSRVDELTDNETGEYIGNIQFTGLKNIRFIYALNNDLNPNGFIASHMNETHYESFSYTVPYLTIATLICFFITLCIPYRYLDTIPSFSYLSRIKFGILSTLWCTLIWFAFCIVYYISDATMTGSIFNVYQSFRIEKFVEKLQLTPILNIMSIFAFLSLIVFLAYMIKYFFHKGIKAYTKENTIIGWLWTHGYTVLNQIVNFNFNDSINKAILRIVLVNFVIVSILCFFFVAGPLFAFIYSIIIFFILRDKFGKIKNDYQVLLLATKKLSNGDFNYEINQDIGIFNPLKEEFTHIKDGFEKAVNEEVKSQKMKTELISNVSHDLKTPLTSIITYVDLLKDENLSPEQRNEYVQILNRNSLRLKNLIDDLFEVSKASSGNVQLNKVDIDIISLMKQAQLECQDQLDQHSLDIRTNFTNEKMICHLDSSKTYRIFENLFINISKYALEHTRVYLEANEDNEKVTIIFKNISKDEMKFNEKEIVERFVQGDSSRNTSGSGLGLAIVKSFTEIQGGQFKVELDGDLFKTILIFKK